MMPLNFEFQKKSEVLNDFIKILQMNEIIEIDYEDLETNGIKINSFKLKKNEPFFEIGFMIFLKWFYTNKEANYTTNFINLNDNATLFLHIYPNNRIINHYKMPGYVKNIFKGFPTGDKKHDLCPICHMFQYNLGCLENKINQLEIPRSHESCKEHKKELEVWVEEKIRENKEYGQMFGGDVYLFDLNPSISEFLFSLGVKINDELLNSFLALYVLVTKHYDIITSNNQLHFPFKSNEFDVFLWNEKDGNMVALETTQENEIDNGHFKKKMYTAALLNTINPINFKYQYITMGFDDDVNNDKGHSILYKNLENQYGVPFELITLPQSHKSIKNKKTFNSGCLDEVYNHFLSEISNLL